MFSKAERSLRKLIKKVFIKLFGHIEHFKSKIQNKTHNMAYLNKLVFTETDRLRQQDLNPRAWTLRSLPIKTTEKLNFGLKMSALLV